MVDRTNGPFAGVARMLIRSVSEMNTCGCMPLR